jgi:hypothetical protein
LQLKQNHLPVCCDNNFLDIIISIYMSWYLALLIIYSNAVSSIAATRLAKHLKGFGIEAGSTPGKGCADATFALKTTL